MRHSHSSRRSFLKGAAGLAGGIAIASTAGAIPALAATPDPILTLIERHKAAHAAYVAAVDVENSLEEALEPSLRCSSTWAHVLSIVPGDDPRWIAAVEERNRTSDEADEIALAILDAQPTTVAGVFALLRYGVEFESAGHLWPDGLVEDGSPAIRDWFFFMNRTLVHAIGNIVA